MDTNDTTLSETEIARGFRNSDGKKIIDHRASESGQFHTAFDSNVRELMEPVRDVLLESTESCMVEEIIGQLLMNFLGENGDCLSNGRFSPATKTSLVMIAEHLGPDWAQALYHAAVFITKVA